MKKAIKTSVRVQKSGSMYLAKVWFDGHVMRGTGWSRGEALWDAKRKVRRMSGYQG
jgi:hypothetical protein